MAARNWNPWLRSPRAVGYGQGQPVELAEPGRRVKVGVFDPGQFKRSQIQRNLRVRLSQQLAQSIHSTLE